MSAILGILISIPICICAYRDEVVDVQAVDVVQEAPIMTVVEPVIERIALGEFKVTAYCTCSNCCGEWSDGLTFTETVATESRTIAVDPDVIPLGSIVEINGVEYVAEDIGGAIKDKRIDIFFSNHEDALNWGVQYQEVFLIEEN